MTVAPITIEKIATIDTPASGKVALAAKNDGNLYTRQANGTEALLVGQTMPMCVVDGNTGTFLYRNSGFVAGVTVNGVGDWTITLAVPWGGAGNVALPRAWSIDGAGPAILAATVAALPFTQIRIYSWDAAGAAHDTTFCVDLAFLGTAV